MADRKNLTFEPKILKDFRLDGHQYCCAYSMKDGKAPDGKDAIRYELRQGDQIVSGSKRAEAELPISIPQETEIWVGMSYWFEQYDKDSGAESIWQLHDTDGSRPPLSIQVQGGAMKIVRANNTEGNTHYPIGNLEVGKRTDIVIHAKLTTSKTGVLEVWRDGVKRVSVSNVITHSKGGSYGKVGINKWSWAPGGGASNVSTARIFHLTEYRMGNSLATYADVAPGDVIAPPPPPPPPLPNEAPVAVAGLDQVIKLPVNDVVVNGQASTDKDGRIVSYQWLLGGKVVLNAAQGQINDLPEGTHTIDLVVTDDKGATGKDILVVTVLKADPVAEKKIVKVETRTTITFSDDSTEIYGS
jgi:hypothetical protein